MAYCSPPPDYDQVVSGQGDYRTTESYQLGQIQYIPLPTEPPPPYSTITSGSLSH